MGEQPVIPDYSGACVSNVVPALLGDEEALGAWVPSVVTDAARVVLFVIDGLGWHQFQEHAHVAPTLAAMQGGPIDTVCPSTTSTAMTSITTGCAPGEHGVIGYRMAIDGEILNVLRWCVEGRDARERIPPEKLQSHEPFGSQRPAVVTRTEFRDSGFTRAHLDGVRFTGYRTLSTMVTEVGRLARAHEPFVYTYYDGLDKVAHEYGLGEHYEAELAALDMLVEQMARRLPPDTALVVTADHGHVEVGENVVSLGPEVLSHVELLSGEGRFRWLHAVPGHERDLLETTEAHHADTGWVRPVDQVLDEGWFGPIVTPAARRRLGDVALLARDDVAYLDPTDSGPYVLVGRHGSMTPAEVSVPLLALRT